jgi:hypothetical protein
MGNPMPYIAGEQTNIVRLTPGKLPAGIKKVVKRIDIDLPDNYYSWADNFALLDERLVARLTILPGPWSARSIWARGWNALPYVYWCHRRVGRNYLWVYPWDKGWSIECYCPAEEVAGVLTIDRMPILCSNPLSAMHIAEACYPIPQKPLRWLPRDIGTVLPTYSPQSEAALDHTRAAGEPYHKANDREQPGNHFN